VTKKMLDMFRRPDDPPEYNQYYLLPGAGMHAAEMFWWYLCTAVAVVYLVCIVCWYCGWVVGQLSR